MTSARGLVAVVMAAGQGTRMKSDLPKVLHRAAGRPLVYYSVKAALDLGVDKVVIVVSPTGASLVQAALEQELPGAALEFAVQEVPRGTGDAVRSAAASFADAARVLILSGDTPLLTAGDLAPLLAVDAGLAFLTFEALPPHSYGRVLRDGNGRVTSIREAKDVTSEIERGVTEVNAGVYLAERAGLVEALSGLRSNNAQGEYYLTDVVPFFAERAGSKVVTVSLPASALSGVNDRAELHAVSEALFARKREVLGRSGVTVVGEPRIDDSVQVSPGAIVEHGARLRGQTTVARGALVDVGVVLENAEIGEESLIKPHSVVTDSRVGARAQIGPLAHLRPGSVIEDDAHIGNFVETKQTVVRRGAKANHLAYLGDADVGEKANIGAGTIVCNYDGFQKQRTVIGEGVFIGSDSQLVAPVTVGAGAYVATGTTVTEDVPEGALAIGRVRQQNKEGYAAPLRKKLKAAAAATKAKKG